mgnify:FL=1
MLPLDASSVIGSIGGIAEIAREAFGGGGLSQVQPRKSPVPGITQKS